MYRFKPSKPLKYPTVNGNINQAELYDIILSRDLDLFPIAKIVNPLLEARQKVLQDDRDVNMY